MPHPLIAIDGPVAVGKTSVGMRLAQILGCRFIDTGAMYRALTWKALQADISPNDREKLAHLAETTDIDIIPSSANAKGYRVLIDGKDETENLRSTQVEASVSLVSSVPEVRRVLVMRQQKLAEEGSAVVVGRDIATTVLPQAELKIFLTASPEQRAIRRYNELKAHGKQADYKVVLDYLNMRDSIDSTRETSPLRFDSNHIVVDTDNLTLDEVVQHLYNLAHTRQ